MRGTVLASLSIGFFLASMGPPHANVMSRLQLTTNAILISTMTKEAVRAVVDC